MSAHIDKWEALRKWAKDAANGKSDKIPYIDITDLINENAELRAALQTQQGEAKDAAQADANAFGPEDAIAICDDQIKFFESHNRFELASAVEQVKARIKHDSIATRQPVNSIVVQDPEDAALAQQREAFERLCGYWMDRAEKAEAYARASTVLRQFAAPAPATLSDEPFCYMSETYEVALLIEPPKAGSQYADMFPVFRTRRGMLSDEQQRQVEKCLKDGSIMGSVSDATVDAVRALLAAAGSSQGRDVVDAAQELMEVIDGYPDQLVPINRESVTCKTLRAALAAKEAK